MAEAVELASDGVDGLYVSFDLDAVDAAPRCPGTGTPEPGGVSARETLRMTRALSEPSIARDLVEMARMCDLLGIERRARLGSGAADARPGCAHRAVTVQPTNGVPKPDEIERLFGRPRGAHRHAVHLRPLPGAPRYVPGRGDDGHLEQALSEARLLEECGFDGVIIENSWDIPFVKPEQVGHGSRGAAMAVVADRIEQAIALPVGVNCLANAVHAW